MKFRGAVTASRFQELHGGDDSFKSAPSYFRAGTALRCPKLYGHFGGGDSFKVPEACWWWGQLHGAPSRREQLQGAPCRREQLHGAPSRREQLHGAPSRREQLQGAPSRR